MTQTTTFADKPTSLFDLLRAATSPLPKVVTRDPRPELTWSWDDFESLMYAAGYESLAKLATAAGMERNEFWSIKGGHYKRGPTMYTIAKLCRALKCQPGDWLSYESK
jgi:DNA-binding Xre family transcriptional regulator